MTLRLQFIHDDQSGLCKKKKKKTRYHMVVEYDIDLLKYLILYQRAHNCFFLDYFHSKEYLSVYLRYFIFLGPY